ncbi:hypothetical protein [Paenisporosarcina sp. TG20]|uniref:hypothetical protein n=1 Tax=Paenisporosarcina sp. TG20 TaxID=1211706 RepID=UPI0002F3F326|nr:hypothetical protein [Paenisporosarcina sp. TG20]
MNRKLLILLGTVGCLISFFVLISNLNDSEKTLAASIEDTKKEHQKIEALLTKVSQEFNEHGYGEASLSFSSEERLLRVQVKDEKFEDNHGKGMKSLIHDVSKEIRFEDVEVIFDILDIQVEVSEEEKKQTEQLNETIKITSEVLNEKNYQFSSVSINPTTSFIEIRIEGTKEYYNAVKEEISNLVADAISSKTNMNFDVKVNRRSENELRDEKWHPIFTTIREETDKKFEEYKGFAYSFHPEPLQIIIKTDLNKSKWWWNSDKKVKEIENYVQEIIKLKREELLIEEIPYEIIVRGKESKKLN